MKVFYSSLDLPTRSHYARKQMAKFGAALRPEEVERQNMIFDRELGASEYLFVPM